jgi:hypothetical protein
MSDETIGVIEWVFIKIDPDHLSQAFSSFVRCMERKKMVKINVKVSSHTTLVIRNSESWKEVF